MALGKLLKRQMVPPAQPNAYVDSLGRVSRFYDTVYSGVFVDETAVLSVPGIWRGVTLISDAIAALPFHAYRGDQRLDPTPSLLERPYPAETRVETIAAMVSALLIYGNYVAVLGEPGANGYPDSLYPVAPNRVTILRREGRLVYKVDDREYDQSEVMHVKGFSLPGHVAGAGILSAQKQGLGIAIALQEYAAKYFDGGAQPTGILYSTNPDLDQDEADLLKAMWVRHYGGPSREPAVLNESIKFEQLSDNAKDSQLVESRTFSLTEVANMLGIPGSYIGAPNSSRTYANIEQENQSLLRWSLTPWLSRIEATFTDYLPRGQYAKFNVDALLRSDTLSRYQAHKIALESGFLTVDEVRTDFENRPSIGEAETTSALAEPNPLSEEI
jgi:HK97 family phage portal protein